MKIIKKSQKTIVKFKLYLNNYENKLKEIKGRKSKKSKNKEIINELLNINEI